MSLVSRCSALCLAVLLAVAGCADEEVPPPEAAEPTAPVDTAGPAADATPDTAVALAPDGPAQAADARVPSPPGVQADPSGRALRADFEGTTQSTEAPGAEGGLLRAVRTAQHEDFDRIVFEFAGSAVPGYRVEYIDGPVRRCGEGGLVDLPGQALLAVRINPAETYTVDDLLAVRNVSRIADLPVVEEHALVCDEQGEVAWVLGLNEQSRYRTLTLTDPPRLVVDLRHGR